MTKPKTKKLKKKKKLKPELMDLINNLIKSLKDPRDKAKIQSLIKGNKPKDVLFEMKQILRNFNPYHRQGSSYVVSSEAPPVKKSRSKKIKPETPSWYNPGVAVSEVPEMRQYMATATRANAYDGNISAINQEAFKNLLQSELDKVKQEVSHLSAHLHDQTLRPPPPLELGDSPRPMDPVPFPPSEETLKSIGGIFSSPSSVFYQANQPESKSASSSSSSAKTRTSSRFGDPPSSFTRSHDQLISPPAHNTRSRAKP